jgi:hypothetical protein
VRANHVARSVTITFDADRVSVTDLLGQLQAIGTVALDLADPREWPRLLAQEVVPLAEDPSSFPGRLSRELSAVTEGRLDLSRLTALVLASSAVLQLRGALLRGEVVPWLRMLAYVIAAVSLWQRHRETVEETRSGAGAGRDAAGVRLR